MAESGEKTTTAVNTPPAHAAIIVRRKTSAGLLLGIAMMAVAGGAGSAWFVLRRERIAEASRPTEADTAPKYMVHLEGFTVNLADAEESHFLRVTIDLGIDRLPKGIEKEKDVAAISVPRIRDAVLSVLTVSKADNLLTPEGKMELKKNLIVSLNQKVPELGVRDVYFTEFLVQR